MHDLRRRHFPPPLVPTLLRTPLRCAVEQLLSHATRWRGTGDRHRIVLSCVDGKVQLRRRGGAA